jgi:RNA polymerase sigma-70 factor (ECF subfamily)
MASTPAFPDCSDGATHFRALIHEHLQHHTPDTVLCRAFHVLHPLYTSVLRRFAGRYLAAADAEDLVQETWVRAWVNLASFDWRRPVAMRAWLSAVLRNRAVNMLKARKRHPAELGCERELGAVVDPTPGPAEELEAQWERDRAAALLPLIEKRLSKTEYRVLVLRYMEERTPADIARELGLTPNKVAYAEYRAKRKLRKTLGVYYGEKQPERANAKNPT